MSAHTPGPWEFRVYSGVTTIVSKHEAPGSTVRDRIKGVRVCVDGLINDDQSNAAEASPDALVMVAAPELLEALRGLLRIADQQTDEFRAASAAIAKAVQS